MVFDSTCPPNQTPTCENLEEIRHLCQHLRCEWHLRYGCRSSHHNRHRHQQRHLKAGTGTSKLAPELKVPVSFPALAPQNRQGHLKCGFQHRNFKVGTGNGTSKLASATYRQCRTSNGIGNSKPALDLKCRFRHRKFKTTTGTGISKSAPEPKVSVSESASQSRHRQLKFRLLNHKLKPAPKTAPQNRHRHVKCRFRHRYFKTGTGTGTC